MNIVIAMPITSKIKEFRGHPILLPDRKNGLTEKSEVLVFHIRSISKDRLVNKIGSVNQTEVDLAMKTLNDILSF